MVLIIGILYHYDIISKVMKNHFDKNNKYFDEPHSPKILDDMKINSSSSSMVVNILKDALSNTNSRKII